MGITFPHTLQSMNDLNHWCGQSIQYQIMFWIAGILLFTTIISIAVIISMVREKKDAAKKKDL